MTRNGGGVFSIGACGRNVGRWRVRFSIVERRKNVIYSRLFGSLRSPSQFLTNQCRFNASLRENLRNGRNQRIFCDVRGILLFLTSVTRERLDVQMYPLVPLEIVIAVLPVGMSNDSEVSLSDLQSSVCIDHICGADLLRGSLDKS